MHGYQLALHRNASDQIEEECLACAVLANNDAECGATLGQAVDILYKGGQFTNPAHLYQVLSDTRNNPCAQ
ncbi:hypothetical protein PSA5_08395 [Pseudomonas syringae pv. actinidiae]|nr:hypothetical protein PSA5_08395 [Pseudomonas syringae pv. actinidiae]